MDEPKRIIDLTETQLVGSGDYLALDSEDGGTKKVKASYFSGGSKNYMWGGIQGDIADQTDLYDYLKQFPDKANIDGYYEDMSVGSAEQLLSNTYEPDSTPYLYRTSGGSLEIGDRVYEDAVVGGSVAWNQLLDTAEIHKSGTPTSSNWVTTSGHPMTLINGHKYLLVRSGTYSNNNNACRVISTTGTTVAYNSTNPKNGNYQTIIFNCTETRDTYYIQAYVVAEEAYDFYLNVFDLTLMFGSTIADYAYTLETSEAGSGIAWLKANGFFTKDYYAYNAGGIESVKTSAKKVVGFNQWNEQWEVGYISSNGSLQSGSGIRSKNYCKCIPNTTYRGTCPSSLTGFMICWYDGDKNFISRSDVKNKTAVSPTNAYYFKVSSSSGDPTTYNHDICINFHWDGERDGEYEAYVEHTYPLDSDLELRGIPKLDTNNKLYYDGDVYESDGTVTRKYGIVDLGTLTWTKNATYQSNWRFTANLSGVKRSDATSIPNIVCSKYQANSPQATYLGYSGISINNTSDSIEVCDLSYSDAATFKTTMNGVYLVYELATPTTESADPYTSPQLVDNWGTEEFVDERDVPVPVGHNSRYLPDLKAKLESAPNNPSTNGLYFLQYQNGEATYVPVPSEVPQTPSEDGTYVLKATVSSGTATLSWVAEE